MGSNMLALPFRRSPVVSLSNAIKQYISTKYDQPLTIFSNDLETIDQLRTTAVQATDPHTTGVNKLQAYAAQLVWLSGKFPMDIGVEFTWYPSLGYDTARPESQSSLSYELVNVLFNLAAMYSQLGMSSRSSPDALKTASNYFCLAAGTLEHLQLTAIPEMRSPPPDDMDPITLECLQQLMLAQGQECAWQTAVKGGYKDLLIAKVSAKVSDLYGTAADLGTKSEVVKSEWIHHMKAKHYHFAAAAQYRAACDCLDKRKYGEEVGRLKDSLECVTEALKESKYINKVVVGDLQALKSRVQEDLRRAEKDNDVIYLMPVPSRIELKPIDQVAMASSKIPVEVKDPVSNLGDKSSLGPPLFTQLVPYVVHSAAEMYEKRKEHFVSEIIIQELENLNQRIHELLESLNLPGALQAIEKPLGLPQGLITHAEEVRQQDGPDRIQRAIQETEKLKRNDRNILNEGRDLLIAENDEDDRLRRKYGTDRWSRVSSSEAGKKLHAQIPEIDGYLNHAESSDKTVLEKLAINKRLILLLHGDNRGLEQYVPNSRRAAIAPTLEQAIRKLRTCLNELGRLETRRKQRISAVLQKVQQDIILSDLTKEASRLEREYPMQKIDVGQFEDLFLRHLKKYDAEKALIIQEENEQNQLAQKLQEHNKAFVHAKMGDTSSKDREKALQSLESAYFKYKEIISNLDAGRRFYNDLAKMVTTFRDECRKFTAERRAEAAQSEAELSTGMSALNLNAVASLQEQKTKQAETRRSARLSAQEPIPAPQPTRKPAPSHPSGMWNPDMGIQFGSNSVNNGSDQNPPASTNSQKGWDPSRGMKFS